MSENANSSALKLIKLVWNNASRKSWPTFNHAMQDAVSLAIKSGMEFGVDDFKTIFDTMRGWKWFVSEGNVYGEWMYRLAVESKNASACRSFEAWKGRKPFIVDGQRLHVRCPFNWQGIPVKVTSFAEDQSYVTACSYRKETRGDSHYLYETGTVDKRYKITHEDIREWSKLRRESIKESEDEQTPT